LESDNKERTERRHVNNNKALGRIFQSKADCRSKGSVEANGEEGNKK